MPLLTELFSSYLLRKKRKYFTKQLKRAFCAGWYFFWICFFFYSRFICRWLHFISTLLSSPIEWAAWRAKPSTNQCWPDLSVLWYFIKPLVPQIPNRIMRKMLDWISLLSEPVDDFLNRKTVQQADKRFSGKKTNVRIYRTTPQLVSDLLWKVFHPHNTCSFGPLFQSMMATYPWYIYLYNMLNSHLSHGMTQSQTHQ